MLFFMLKKQGCSYQPYFFILIVSFVCFCAIIYYIY
nr:MAG TPA: hypothetical protein [Caudoviricetes sp.]